MIYPRTAGRSSYVFVTAHADIQSLQDRRHSQDSLGFSALFAGQTVVCLTSCRLLATLVLFISVEILPTFHWNKNVLFIYF